MTESLVECVINVSEGRDENVLAALADAAAPVLLDVHRDRDHHRAVFTLAGPPPAVTDATRALARVAVARIDLGRHQGVHPRLGALDVVPFVPFRPDAPPPQDLSEATILRDAFAHWLADELGVPSFLYGPLPGGGTRSLPDLRRQAFAPPEAGGLEPYAGPPTPHPTAGATAVGARPVLVAYNVWVSRLETARAVAPLVRGPHVRALALEVDGRAQVSCNLVDPAAYGPDRLFDAVTEQVGHLDGAVAGTVEGAELVGLLPRSVLDHVDPDRYAELGLSKDVTVEHRLAGR